MSGVFRAGLHLLRACLGRALLLGLVLALLTNVPNTLLIVYAEQNQQVDSNTLFNVLVVGAMLLAVLVHGALIATFHSVATGADGGLGFVLHIGLRRYLAVVGCLLAYTVIVLLGYVALILPGLILTITLLFAHFLVITEELSVNMALKRSHALVWGHWWRTSVILNVMLVISLVVFLVVGMLAGAGFYLAADSEPTATSVLVVVAVVIPLISAILTPLLYAWAYVTLADLQQRKRAQSN